MQVLAIIALLPASAPLFFTAFWLGFEFWRRHHALALSMIVGTLAVTAVAAVTLRDHVLAVQLALPLPVRVLGWVVIAAATIFGTIADRQIGLRVRMFTPFFEETGRIELKTTGAYGVVRHPIYASGIWFQLGVFLATGYVAVAIAAVIFALGALWFTRQEEHRMIPLLDDPDAYARYREKVPSLFPWFR
jgi:protein-S-isoprenylcysteine O-methyltransferase Ste14